MKKIIIAVLSLCSFSTFLLCCKKSSQPTCKYDSIPSSLILKFTKNGNPVGDNILTNVKLSYFEGSTKKYVTDFAISTDTVNQNKGLKASRNIGILSADNNIKTYYIEYPNGWTEDTLYVDYLPNTPSTNCVYVQNAIKVNVQMASIDSSFHFDSPVFIVNNP